MTLDRGLANRELVGNLFIRIPSRDQAQYVDFTRGQAVIRRVLGKLCGNLGRYALMTGMNRPDSLQEFSMHVALQDVCPGACFESAQRLYITSICSQDDDSRVRKLTSDFTDRVNAVCAWHLKIHQGYIRTMQSKLFYGILAIGRFGD